MKSIPSVSPKTVSHHINFFSNSRNFELKIPLMSALALLFIFYATAQAATLPQGFVETQVADGLANPVAMEFAPDGRLFVSEQVGTVRIVKNGVLLSTPFINLTNQVDSAGERGVFGIAFDPNFSSNHYVYIYYTAKSPASHNRVSRFTANGDVAVAGSEVVIFELNNLGASTFHNGGAIHFGADNKLYIATGEANTSSNADSFENLLGKILRINADGSIPTDNPFYNTASGNNRAIWVLGLRNPYTFAVQPGTGRIFINDVGENTWEEINDGIAGSHYGWPNTEGPTTNPSYRSPILAYQHGTGEYEGCAITGGTFYNPQTPQFPNAITGSYFFADYCGGWIRRLDLLGGGSSAVFAFGISSPVDLKVGPEGSLYYLARGSSGQSGDFRSNTGVIFKISYADNQPPPQSDEVSLSDLSWTSATNGWGPVERDSSNGEQASGDGHIITINATTYAKGLGTHAPSEIIYNLGGNYTKFISDIGIDDEVGDNGTVTFEVWADGVKLYDSGIVRGSSAKQSINVDVTGRQQLRLVVTDGGDGVYADHGDWAGARLQKSTGSAPTITRQPLSQTVSQTQSVTFTVEASGSSPLNYQWQRNGVDIAGATSPGYTLAFVSASDNGARFRAVVSNAQGSATSNEATLTVNSNQVPTATILTPQAGTFYSAGETISFSGTGTDPEDAQLPASAFTWEVVFHHDTHTHPFINPFSGVKSGTFTIPASGETSTNVWYRIYLTVKDSAGATNTTFRDIFPRTSSITFNTSPTGLQLLLDGQPHTSPVTLNTVDGMPRIISVVSPQTLNGTTYIFSSWSDGSTLPTRTITTPSLTTTYTAIFSAQNLTSLTDDFNDNTRDAKWSFGVLNEPSSTFDPLLPVLERNQRLEISPRANLSGSHYSGYISTGVWNFVNASATVEVVQAAVNGADTVFAIGTDSNNWYRFVVEDGKLYFQNKVNGVKDSTNIPYDPVQHRFWRFFYNPAFNNAVIFETSSNGQNWIIRRSVSPTFAHTAMRVELNAGTFAPVGAPGTAIFDNFQFNTFQTSLGLSASSYIVNEGDATGVATVTVNRTGDALLPVSVDFRTGDTSGLVPCQTNTSGVASERCDYASSAGTLHFASGEVSKTILIPIINDAYVEPSESFNITLSNPQDATLGAITSGTVTIQDNDVQAVTSNPIEDQAFFIRQQYIDFLGRQPDPNGFTFWMNRMNNCPAGQVCDRIDTSMRFFQSDEFQERGFYVYRLYDAVLGRLPKYAEFVPDVARLNGFQNVIEQRLNKDAYLQDFINKAEFRSMYGQYLSADGLTATSPDGFVNALCAAAGITPASKQTLITNLQTGTRDPAHTLEDFILTPELSAVGSKFYDRGFIVMQYFGYLHRDPEAGGFDFWRNQLIGANAPHRQDYRFMVNGFIKSDEYCFRFALISAK